MTTEKVTVGNVEILAIPDCTLAIDACTFFVEKSPGDMDPYRDYIDEDCKVRGGGINVGTFLVLTQGPKVLVDAGVGPGPWDDLGGLQGDLPEQMRRRGVDPSDIDTVVATHMHFDHIGWLVTNSGGKLQRTFPKAKYVIPRIDWDLLLHPEKMESPPAPNHFSQEAFAMFAKAASMKADISQMGNVELVSGEHHLTDEITIVPTPGHTPGHQSLLVTSAGERAFVMGDVAHMPMQLHVPQWILAADVQPELGVKTRTETLDWLEKEGMLVASGHFPVPGFGRVVRVRPNDTGKPSRTPALEERSGIPGLV